MTRRDIFGELMEGILEMKPHREGAITLRTHKVTAAPLPRLDPAPAEASEGIREGLEDAKAGRTRPAREFFREFEAARGIKRSRRRR